MSAIDQVFAADDREGRAALAEALAGALDRGDGAPLPALRALIARQDLFATLPEPAIDAIASAAREAVREAGGGTARAHSIARRLRSRAERLIVFGCAGRACATDGGGIDEQRASYLEALQAALGLRDEEAEALLFSRSGESDADSALGARLDGLRAQLPRLLDTMALFAFADGSVDERERVALASALARIGDARLLGEAGLARETEAALARVSGRQPDEVLAELSAAVTDPSDRFWFAVYAHAVVFADGVQDPAEVKLLARMGAAFDLHPAALDAAAVRAREISGE